VVAPGTQEPDEFFRLPYLREPLKVTEPAVEDVLVGATVELTEVSA
jgi:hypothetical protein